MKSRWAPGINDDVDELCVFCLRLKSWVLFCFFGEERGENDKKQQIKQFKVKH